MKNTCLDWNNPSDLFRLVQLLQEGKIIVGTSDTILGLLGIVSEGVFEDLNSIKGRLRKPYIILIPSFDYLKTYVKDDLSDSMRNMLHACWPGPLTVIFSAKDSLPDYVKSESNTIALRIPNHDGLQYVMKKVGPLFSTSANQSGEPVPESIDMISPKIMQQVAICINQQKKPSLPSTIIDCTGPKPKVIRVGALPLETITSFW